jgi:NADPH:quinone reductase-like Zn-dependent oxidoreductase
MADTMRAAVFAGVGDIHLDEVPTPSPGPTDAIVRMTRTTICGTDSHIWRGEYPVAAGRVVGHEPVGVIHELGEAVRGYEIGQRVVVGAITPCGSCYFSFLNQPIEVPALRPRLMDLVRAPGIPQLLLRMGFGPEVPPAPGRPLEDVLIP